MEHVDGGESCFSANSGKNGDSEKQETGEEMSDELKSNDCRTVGTEAECFSAEKERRANDDAYFYTRRNEFTSEVFKIEVGGLPSKFGFGELKKLFNSKLNLKSHKLKTIGHQSKFAFVTFRCEEDREKALTVLNGYKWKGRTLTVKKANPSADPLVKKRKHESVDCDVDLSNNNNEIDAELPGPLRLKSVVMPLWNLPYEEQLKKKLDEVVSILVKLSKQVEKTWPMSPIWLKRNKQNNSSMCCVLEGVKASPVMDGYRNKCEFSVGFDDVDGKRTVGFRLARYSSGSMSVCNPSECSIVPKKALDVCAFFEKFVQQSAKEPYNPERYSGFWRQLTVRTTKDECLVIVVMHPQDLTESELNSVKNDLKNYFCDVQGNTLGVTSLYYQAFGKRVSGEEWPLEHLGGNTSLTESISGLKFRISPLAFFQVNSAATEVLYSSIGEIALINLDTTLLDICCGTGTIGITLAKKVKRVIGIEMVFDAVEDARFNAALNELSNVEFHHGKVEDKLPSILRNLADAKDIVAIIDPPRAGLHNKVVKAIRGFSAVHQLIYVSCDLSAAMTNLVEPESNSYHGRPFSIVKAVAIDVFPQTTHYEVVVLLERELKTNLA